MIQGRLTVFCKLAILWAVVGFSKNFSVKASKCDCDGKHQKTRSKRRFRDVKFFFQIANLLLRNGV